MAEYIKDNKKSKLPTSIRFNEVQLKIAMSKSGKESKQQLIDFLIDRYINGENPILERQANEPPPYVKQYFKDKPSQLVTTKSVPALPTTPKTEYYEQPQLLDKFSQICQNIQYADSRKEIEKYVAQAIKELDWKKQALVKEYAEKIIEQKGFVYSDLQ